MKKKITTITICIMFLAGLSLLLYPFISNEWNTYRQERLISSYDEQVKEQAAAGTIDYEKEWKEAAAYNDALLPSILPDSFAVAEASEEEDEEYMSSLNLNGDGMMGYVEIPKLDVKCPVYHTTEKEVLEKAAGHLEGSSLPVGGANTHSVISAHRGLPSAKLFTDLDKLVEGDHFLISILDDTLCYEVDKISIVEPTETEGLAVEDGEDLVTLLTCTPYGVNSHRLLVRGHRVPYEEAEMEEAPKGLIGGTSLHTSYLLWVLVGLGVTALFILALYIYEKKIRAVKMLKSETAIEPENAATAEATEQAATEPDKTEQPKEEQ